MADEPKVDLAVLAAGLAAKHGDPAKALEKLIDENHDLRGKNRDLRTQLTDAQAKVPGDDAVVLTAKDAKAWAAFQALGVSPEDAKAGLGERDTLKTAIADRDARDARATAADKAAAALGWNAKALRTFADDKRLTLELRDVETDDGKGGKVKTPVPHVLTGEGATATAEPLDAYVAREADVYLPALTAKAAPGNGAAGNGNGAPARPSGPAYPASPLHTHNGGNGQSDEQRAAELRGTGQYAF